VTHDEVLYRAWQQLQWFAFREQQADVATKPHDHEVPCLMAMGYIRECAAVYREIEALRAAHNTDRHESGDAG
jgi:hypothetical protein